MSVNIPRTPGKEGIKGNVGETLLSGLTFKSAYRPRVIHVNADTVKRLIGVASHLAWRDLMNEKASNIDSILRSKGTPLMRVDFNRHKELTSYHMKRMIWNLVQPYIGGATTGGV